MTIEALMDGIRKNIARVKEYKLGMDGTGGQCDCIGLIIGGVRLAGGKWTGTHGSNWAARNAVKNLNQIPDNVMPPSAVLQVGDMVFKARTPEAASYDLPGKYASSGDMNDYYHVGVVTSVHPLEITHCTSVAGGIKRDTSLGEWMYYGQYIGITEEMSMGAEGSYTVTGGQLKMRTGPGTNYSVISYIPNGKTVQAAQITGEPNWLYVKYGKDVGYCMAKYLVPADTDDDDTVTISRADWERIQALTKEMTGILSTAIIKG